MPRKLNGHTPPEELDPDFVLTTKLLNEYKDKWNEQFQTSEIDAVKFSRLSIVALTQWAAILAVDVGMQPQQFVAVCNIQFGEAHKRAPRFGD